MPNTLFEFLCAKCVERANQSIRYVSRLSMLFCVLMCLSKVLETVTKEEENKRKRAANTNSGQAHRTIRCARLADCETTALGKT
jgi:23S rRNA maturation mini-RNase III